MSKKASDAPSSIRIRENQRRSRNQRKELIQDLQRRVQEYEAQGIAATQEMQRAARKVAEENVRLKSLLASRGVAHDEVEAYLRSFDVANAPSPSAASFYALPTMRPHSLATQGQSPVGYAAVPQLPLQAPACTPHQPTYSPAQHHPSSFSDLQRVRHSLTGALEQTACEAEQANVANTSSTAASHKTGEHVESEKSTCCRPVELQGATNARTTAGEMLDHGATSYPGVVEGTECPNTTSCFCPPTSASQEQSTDTGLLISCEMAASIISEMRGDGDTHRIRASLGCRGDQDCNVKNTLVLELMDER